MIPNFLISGGPDDTWNANYRNALAAVGASSSGGYLPPADISGYDALFLCGGVDVAPWRYGEENNGSLETDEVRDEREFELLDRFLSAGKPVFGVCRGEQIINVYFGGTLIGHLPTADSHTGKVGLTHPVHAANDGFVGRIYGEDFIANSIHHQAVGVPGKGIRPVARAADGVVEAIEHESLLVRAVQWHPERLCLGLRKENDVTVDGLTFFRYVVESTMNQ